MTHLLDQFRNYNIHEDDYRALPAKVRDCLDRLESVEFYTAGLKNGKKFNKVKEFKRVVKAYKKNIDKHNGEESNVECIMIDQLLELMRRMTAAEIRQLGLHKIL